MNKDKLAIISSYDELCGNASYTKALEKELSNHFDVTVIGLDVELLRKGASKEALEHIRNICKKVRNFDCVNIQLEAGLFGPNPSLITKNFFAIAKACPRLVITMHRYHSYDKYPGLSVLGKCILRRCIDSFIQMYKQAFANNQYVPFYHKVIRFCQKHDIPIIVHTQRDKKSINRELGYYKVFDHPLSFYNQAEIESIKKSFSKSDFYKEFRLSDQKIYIGIFGFINKYKGHQTAIKALRCLPHKYELLICGSQHPHTIQVEEPVNSYIGELLEMIDKLKLKNRVHFHRISQDEDFLRALIHCDYNVLPYLEVKQGGSAVAALALESNSKAIFSQNRAFFELEKYAENSLKMFSIGNHMELATAILSYDEGKFAASLKKYHEKYNIHTSSLLYRSLLKRTYPYEQVENKESDLEWENCLGSAGMKMNKEK